MFYDVVSFFSGPFLTVIVFGNLTCIKVWQSRVKAPEVICLKHSHTSGKERALRISAWW